MSFRDYFHARVTVRGSEFALPVVLQFDPDDEAGVKLPRNDVIEDIIWILGRHGVDILPQDHREQVVSHNYNTDSRVH